VHVAQPVVHATAHAPDANEKPDAHAVQTVRLVQVAQFGKQGIHLWPYL
jgi:hypothetical protein